MSQLPLNQGSFLPLPPAFNPPCSSALTHPPCGSETPAAVEAHQFQILSQQQRHDLDGRVEALVAARLEQQLAAELDNMLQPRLDTFACFSCAFASFSPFATSPQLPPNFPPAAVQAHQPLPSPQLQQQPRQRFEDFCVEVQVAARVEQRLAAHLSVFRSNVLDVVARSICDGCSVLESAASMGRLNLLGQLLERMRTSLPTHRQQTDITAAWRAAAEKGHAQCLRLLLESCTSPASVAGLLSATVFKGIRGHTALMTAAREGHVQCLQLLVERSTPTQLAAVNAYELNALMLAAIRGHTSCLQLLLAHSPDAQVAAVSARGLTALMLAAMHGHTSCVLLLLRHDPHAQVAVTGPRGNALMCAAEEGQAACMELLLAYNPGVQMAAVSEDGQDALCLAAGCAHVDCLQLLLPYDPSQQQLDRALDQVCRRLKDQDDPPSEQERLGLRKCIALLLAQGAMLTTRATDEDIAIVRPVSKQLTARALVPDMANEAVVGMALAFRSHHKKPANEEVHFMSID